MALFEVLGNGTKVSDRNWELNRTAIGQQSGLIEPRIGHKLDLVEPQIGLLAQSERSKTTRRSVILLARQQPCFCFNFSASCCTSTA